MPDPIAHATQGSLILLSPFIAFVRRKVWIVTLVVIGALLGDLPDLLGIFGQYVLRDDGALYMSAHRGAIAETLQFLPMYWLHTRLDFFTHDRNSYITRDWIWVEIVVWATNILIIWLFVRVWRRHREG
jgi:hypothetical protein